MATLVNTLLGLSHKSLRNHDLGILVCGYSLRRKGPRWLLLIGAIGLLIANTINVGSDLSGMADAAEMLTGIKSQLYVFVFGAAIMYATVRFRYYQIAMVMKWLAALLFAYVITAFIAQPDWANVLRNHKRARSPHGQ